MSTLTIDLETIPAPWSEAEKDGAASKTWTCPDDEDAQEASWDSHREKIWRDTALDSMRGRILCVGWAIDDEVPRSRITEDDDALRGAFDELVFDLDRVSLHDGGWRSPVTWVGHNIADFDLVWLYQHAHRLRHPLADIVPTEEWDKSTKPRWTRIIDDTYVRWNASRWKKSGSLDAIARFLGLPGKTEGLDGSGVYDLWLAGEYATIAAYCARDVCVARDVWRRLAGDAGKVGLGWPGSPGPLFEEHRRPE